MQVLVSPIVPPNIEPAAPNMLLPKWAQAQFHKSTTVSCESLTLSSHAPPRLIELLHNSVHFTVQRPKSFFISRKRRKSSSCCFIDQRRLSRCRSLHFKCPLVALLTSIVLLCMLAFCAKISGKLLMPELSLPSTIVQTQRICMPLRDYVTLRKLGALHRHYKEKRLGSAHGGKH